MSTSNSIVVEYKWLRILYCTDFFYSLLAIDSFSEYFMWTPIYKVLNLCCLCWSEDGRDSVIISMTVTSLEDPSDAQGASGWMVLSHGLRGWTVVSSFRGLLHFNAVLGMCCRGTWDIDSLTRPFSLLPVIKPLRWILELLYKPHLFLHQVWSTLMNSVLC